MRWFQALLLVVVAACSGPRDTPIPKEISQMESIKPSIEKLSKEEKDLLGGYVMRHTIGSSLGAAFGIKEEPIPDGMTIGKAIDEQRAFVEKRKAEEAAKKLEKERVAAERMALAEQMAQVLSVKLSGLELHKASYKDFDVENRITLTIEFDNKGSKAISGMKGMATFKDKFGDTVSELPIKVEEEIPAGKSVTVRLSKRFNQFDAEDKKLANQDAATANFSVSPEVVLFSDGTKFEAIKAKE